MLTQLMEKFVAATPGPVEAPKVTLTTAELLKREPEKIRELVLKMNDPTRYEAYRREVLVDKTGPIPEFELYQFRQYMFSTD